MWSPPKIDFFAPSVPKLLKLIIIQTKAIISQNIFYNKYNFYLRQPNAIFFANKKLHFGQSIVKTDPLFPLTATTLPIEKRIIIKNMSKYNEWVSLP